MQDRVIRRIGGGTLCAWADHPGPRHQGSHVHLAKVQFERTTSRLDEHGLDLGACTPGARALHSGTPLVLGLPVSLYCRDAARRFSTDQPTEACLRDRASLASATKTLMGDGAALVDAFWRMLLAGDFLTRALLCVSESNARGGHIG